MPTEPPNPPASKRPSDFATPPARPAAGESPAARRTVHFSQGGIRSGGASPSPTAALIPVLLLGGSALAFSGYLALGRLPWLPLPVRAAIVSALFLFVMILLFRAAARGYRRVMSALKMPMEMDTDADLNVICWPDQVPELESLIPKADDSGAFEPEAARVWLARRTSLAARFQTRSQQVRFGVMTGLFVVVLQVGAQLGARGMIDFASVLGVVGVALLLPIAWGFARPMFLRIAPGRVDIVRFGWFGAQPTIETHSLRDRPVRLDMRRKELLIGGWHESQPDAGEPEPPESDPEPGKRRKAIAVGNQAGGKDPQAWLGTPDQIRNLTIIPYWASLDSKSIERALFRAAVSTAEPGPLPDDELIG